MYSNMNIFSHEWIRPHSIKKFKILSLFIYQFCLIYLIRMSRLMKQAYDCNDAEGITTHWDTNNEIDEVKKMELQTTAKLIERKQTHLTVTPPHTCRRSYTSRTKVRNYSAKKLNLERTERKRRKNRNAFHILVIRFAVIFAFLLCQRISVWSENSIRSHNLKFNKNCREKTVSHSKFDDKSCNTIITDVTSNKKIAKIWPKFDAHANFWNIFF